MTSNNMLISGFFTEEDFISIKSFSKELDSYANNVGIQNWAGIPMQSSFDYMNVEAITIAYTLLSSLLLNGSYDLLKAFIIRVWRIISIRSPKEKAIPFTISIEGIPTVDGPNVINCKIQGCLSDEQKAIAVDKTFQIAEQIEKHHFQLMKTYYTERCGHLFRYDTNKGEYVEADMYAEIQEKINQRKRAQSHEDPTGKD